MVLASDCTASMRGADQHWMARATKLFAWMIPGEAAVYRIAELEAAKAWVGGGA